MGINRDMQGTGASVRLHLRRAWIITLISASVTFTSLLVLPSTVRSACPNEGFRTGPSAQLPDCRAYELVTPPDSDGRIFRDPTPFSLYYDDFATELISPFRDSFVFQIKASSLKTPPGGNGRLQGDLYEAERGSSGWHVARHVTPTGAEAVIPMPGGISADHRYNFVFVPVKVISLPFNGSLGQGGDGDYLGGPAGSYELTGVGSLGVERLAQGRYISPEGEHVIFSTGRSAQESGWCYQIDIDPRFKCPATKLEPEAPPTGTGAIYDRQPDGPTHVVSLLPGDTTPGAGENAIYQGVSRDGSSVAFKIGSTLYVRAGNGSPSARTETVTTDPATFAGISSEGIYLFYVTAGNIHRFNTETELDEELNASGDAQMVNVSADGARVYFISPAQLDGVQGIPGEPNLYVWSGDSIEFIATVAESDTTGRPALTNWISEVAGPPPNGFNPGPGGASSRTTPDGSVIVFESRAQLTPPYDNAGHTEIYRYDIAGDSLQCLSCNPSGAPAINDARFESLGDGLEATTVLNNLTVDGKRVFFETPESLVEEDVDSVNDIYEWQETEIGPALALISAGNATEYAQVPGVSSPAPNILMGVSADGSDVFFRSLEPLVPGAPTGGATAIYDARIGGGFPVPSVPQTCFTVDACRPKRSGPPPLEAARSQSLLGPGNVKPRKRPRCRHRHKHRKGQKPHRCQRKKVGVAK